MISRKLALLVSKSKNTLCPQHLPGCQNEVTDWLSFSYQTRDGKINPLANDDPSDDTLSHRFHSFCPQLIPADFTISPLPTEILSFVEQVLRTTESSLMQYNQKRTRTKTVPGADGRDTANARDWTTSCLLYPTPNKSWSPDPSCTPSRLPIGAPQATFLASITKPWQARLSALPQASWLRRSGTISNKAPFTSPTTNSSDLPYQPY